MKENKKITVIILLIFFASTATSQSKNTEFIEPGGIDVFPNHNEVANGKVSLASMISDGQKLFKTVFNSSDGAGRPESTGDSKPTLRNLPTIQFNRIAGPDASSCVDCHNFPFSGGAGGFTANVFVGAHFTDPPTNIIDSDVTNERNTISIFGAGAIETLAYEMSNELHVIKEEALLEAKNNNQNVRKSLQAKDIDFGYLIALPNGTYDDSGIKGVDKDLVVKPFGVKGVAVSLREFTNFALNQHHGIQSEERFGWARTGINDFDGDGIEREFTIGQMSAMVLYQASLPPPKPTVYSDPNLQQLSERGRKLFEKIGCTTCHVPKLHLRSAWFHEPNGFNRPGSALPRDVEGQIMLPINAEVGTGVYRDEQGQVYVAAFTDLKRHVICDKDDLHFCNERRIQDFVSTDQFMTTKLWDAGTSAPYGHRGDITTISEAIIHHSGEAKVTKNNYLSLSSQEKNSVFTFLKSLRVTDEPKLIGDAK